MVGDNRGALAVQPGEDKDESIPTRPVVDKSSGSAVTCILQL